MDPRAKRLADIIEAIIRDGFEEKHLSGNLMDTMSASETADGAEVRIPAPIYNMYKYQMSGAIIPTGGSYAEQLNEEGSAFFIYKRSGGRFWIEPRNHVNFADEAIEMGIEQWLAEMGYDAEVEYK